MNPNLTTLLIVIALSLPVFADRGWGSKDSGKSGSTYTPRSEPAPAVRSAPPSYSRPAPAVSTPFTAPASPRTYTPAPQTFRSATPQSRPETVQIQQPQQREPQQRETRTFVQPAQPAPVREQPAVAPDQTVRSSRTAPENWGGTPNVRTERERQEPNPVVTTPRAQAPDTTPQRTFVPSPREARTPRVEEPQTVKIETPTTERRTTEKQTSPFLFNERGTSRRNRETETVQAPARTPSTFSQAQHQAVTLRSQEPESTGQRTRSSINLSSTREINSDTYRKPVTYSSNDRPSRELTIHRQPAAVRPQSHHPETRSYYAHHYPSHHDRYHRPVTCYSGSAAFWHAFGFTVGASLFAPFYYADVVYPGRACVTTTWHSGPVTVSVASCAPYPVYTYRPYYCSSGWYHHDGWHHSYAYYGGWRCNWYGGFSYIFNPYPVYRTYYLYEEPSTVVIEQPAPQVVYVNPPAQQTVTVPAATVAATQPQPATQVEAAGTEQVAATPETRCFCACKCNGRVPCICEYPCGSEFAYSPDEYTLGGFSSYADSLNRELIWSSYAGLDRGEPEAYVAGME